MRKLATLLFAILMYTTASAQEWIEHTIDDYFDGARTVYATDMDGDGDTDVIGAAKYADEIAWWENTDGAGTIWTEHIVDGFFDEAQCAYTTDVDGDGDIDVIGAADDGDVSWWENANGVGTSWTEHNIDSNFDSPQSLHASDVDGDGDTDVLGAAYFADEITWWENTNGVGTSWIAHTLDGNFDGAYDVYATDIDGDGDTDVLGAANAYNGEISWWENNNGTGTSWTEHIVDENFHGAISVYATDLDNDGDTDVISATFTTNTTAWWENVDGAGCEWTEHIVDDSIVYPVSVYATDVDGDGDTDVLGAGSYHYDVIWWENTDGMGTSWTEHLVDGYFNGVTDVHATDVDGDGDIDVLGAATLVDEITWWENTGSPSPDLIEVTLSSAQPLQVPRGGSFQYEALVTSNLPSPYNVDFWTYVTLPNGLTFGPLQQFNNIPMTPTTIIGPVTLGLAIPQNAFLGGYTFHMQAGRFPTTVVGEDEFPFEVVAATGTNGSPSTDWSAWGLDQLQSQSIAQNSYVEAWPNTFSLSESYPNPFNAATTLTVNLPGSAELSVTVYNVNSQRVAELASGSYSAGTHRFTFDASGLASGLYFIHATVPGQMDQVQKVMLVR